MCLSHFKNKYHTARHSCILPSQAWAQALAGIYFFMNRSPIRDFGDDQIQGVTGFLFNMAETHG